MSTLFVRNLETEDRLQITLDLADSKEGRGTVKTFNLNRQKNEELKVTLERLRLNLSKKLNKKAKRKKKETENNAESSVDQSTDKSNDNLEIPIDIILNGKSVDLSTSNQDAWVRGALLKVEIEIEFANLQECEFYWKTFEAKHFQKMNLLVSKGQVDLSDAVKSYSYTPLAGDLGHHILLVCVPKFSASTGKMEAVISTVPVTQGPGLCPFEKRHAYTSEAAPKGSFRVLTYNILAQIYADTDLARQELFNYCPLEALDMNYRKHLLLKEIIGYKGDLLCLQEVDYSIFHSHLTPALTALGYFGLFRPKAGQVAEGCCHFIRQDKFRLVSELDVTLSEYLSTSPNCADIWAQVGQVPALKEKLEQRSSILQVSVVENLETPGKFVCLANTHLYFHPTACNIRLIHAVTALRHLQSIREAYIQENKDISIIFCGDFNSAPHLGIYQLMTAQMVPADHVDWSSAGPEEYLTGLELSQPINMASACGVPPYTNFTRGFKETLDYIFFDSDKLEVMHVIPMPDHDDVTAHQALPSVVFPSDHIAQICELKFR
ncbi:2 5-phosphodiesterase 12 [Biomphalaria pfeifferi]|uniref:2',5'-phosphodiesterase 12 n=1 Tax=Biomphalaria pfeifferi TaxID=112525 RepID=A0AAD8AXD1_BIOPF|nr:2 5-phosphodiesterase 12 [Biomphalaria pfeifferi]